MSQFDDIIAQREAAADSAAPPPPRNKKLTKLLLCVGIPVVVLAVGISVFFQYFEIVRKEDSVIANDQSVCDALAQEYVTAYRNGYGDNNFNNTEKVKELANKVPNTDQAKKEANCQFFKMYDAEINHDFERALELAYSIKTLLDEGSHLDARMPLPGNIDDIIRGIESQVQHADDPIGGSGA
ncbi:hypothetical protein FWF74_02320 [Candidatus Saccharibacteria bacterium]|nr:hypothetical protein [Candidatus Saccharibacteria bacterium]MCL1963067.1 hypothetical protein [Candidatus Saccharibacteria bacterium]